jgi:tetratricopeptide (TPR) repeat protein
MDTRSLLSLLLIACLATVTRSPRADALANLPEHWQRELAPLEETDLGGAERLMQKSVPEARAEVARLLAQPETDRETLAGAYGRLGALLLLLEIEAQADVCFRNARILQPQEFRWPYYAGYLAMMAGNTEQAVSYLEAARALDPDYPPLYLRLGKVLMDRNERQQARAALERIADVPGLVAPANYYLGQIALLERRFEAAVSHLTKGLDADPTALEAHYPLAQAYRALGEDALARAHLSRFEAKSPRVADPLLEQLQGAAKRSLPAFHKGIHAIRQGDYAAAAARFAEGLAVDPENAAAHVSYARALYLSGRSEEAEAALDEALRQTPDLVLANFLKGVLLQQQGDPEAAAVWYRRALQLDAGHAGALFYLANLDFRARRFKVAAEGYAAALEANDEIAPARLLELIALYRSGTPERVVADALADLRQQHPEDPVLSYAQGRLLAAAQDPAVRAPQRALKLTSRLALVQPIPPHHRSLALAQAARGDFEGAVQTQRQAMLAAWMAPPAEQEAMQGELASYEKAELPSDPWPTGDLLLSPPPFDPVAPFRDYPAAVPY